MLKEYFLKTGWKRIAIMILGNVLTGMGVAIFKLAGLGNDPYNGMNMALSDVTGISYPVFQILVNIVFLIIQFRFGRHFIGIGTIVNAVFLGYFVSFFYSLFTGLFIPQGMVLQVLTLIVGLVICSFGLSLYQTTDVGVAPYDSFALILDKRFPKLPYFWCRMICDGSCALICFLAGGIIGLGTLATALGLGPVIHFFNVHFSEKACRNL